jgi:hypothetical protein
MLARTGLFCTLMFALGGVTASADTRSLLLADHATQSIGDIDFSLRPIWHSIMKCGERLTSESCLLQKMTENPTGTAHSVIIGTALHLAQLIDRARADSPDGFASLRVSQAYLVAAAYEAEVDRLDDARAHYQLALTRAAEVPPSIARFDKTYSIQNSAGSTARGSVQPGVTIGGPSSHVVMGTQSKAEPVKFYSEAQLVREYATRALAALSEPAK